MGFKVTINMDSDNDCGDVGEPIRILRDIADKLEDECGDLSIPLLDYNGNQVGHAEIVIASEED